MKEGHNRKDKKRNGKCDDDLATSHKESSLISHYSTPRTRNAAGGVSGEPVAIISVLCPSAHRPRESVDQNRCRRDAAACGRSASPVAGTGPKRFFMTPATTSLAIRLPVP